MLRIGVLISGRGSNFSAVHNAIEAGHLLAEIVLVHSNRPQAPGCELARSYGLTVSAFSPKEFPDAAAYEAQVVSEMQAAGVDLLVLAGYMRIVGAPLLSAFENRMINIHPSLLPAFKGLNAQGQAFDSGVRYAGCTVHFVDASLDGGPIILQDVVPVLPDDTEETLAARILEREHVLLPQAIQLFAEGRLKIDGHKVKIES